MQIWRLIKINTSWNSMKFSRKMARILNWEFLERDRCAHEVNWFEVDKSDARSGIICAPSAEETAKKRMSAQRESGHVHREKILIDFVLKKNCGQRVFTHVSSLCFSLNVGNGIISRTLCGIHWFCETCTLFQEFGLSTEMFEQLTWLRTLLGHWFKLEPGRNGFS